MSVTNNEIKKGKRKERMDGRVGGWKERKNTVVTKCKFDVHKLWLLNN